MLWEYMHIVQWVRAAWTQIYYPEIDEAAFTSHQSGHPTGEWCVVCALPLDV
jgi:hypothetical protein